MTKLFDARSLALILIIGFIYGGTTAINMDTNVLVEPSQVIENSESPGLLKQVNGLSKIQDNEWQIEQNLNNGQLELTITDIKTF